MLLLINNVCYGQECKSYGMSVRYLSLVPECIFLFLDVSVVCPNNITFNQKLYFYINLLKYVQCLVYVMMSEKRIAL